MAENKIAVLYSKEQKAWHIETLKEYIESNTRFILDITKVQQYRLVNLFDNYDVANQFIKDNYNIFK